MHHTCSEHDDACRCSISHTIPASRLVVVLSVSPNSNCEYFYTKSTINILLTIQITTHQIELLSPSVFFFNYLIVVCIRYLRGNHSHSHVCYKKKKTVLLLQQHQQARTNFDG